MRRMTVTIKIASLVLAASLFTGCSVANTANDTPGASGGAVSGSVAAEDGEEVLAAKSKSYLENSDNRYGYDYDEDKDAHYIAQYRLDGTLVKKSEIEYEEIEWVTDEWLYYSTEDIKTDNDILWRIPIKKTEKGNRLLTDKTEKVLDAFSLEIDYVTDSYIIMEKCDYAADKAQDGVYKYDLGTGKQTELIGAEEAEVLWGNTYPLMWEGNLFFEGYGKLYILDPEKEKVSSLYSFKKSVCMDDYALIGNELYFLDTDDQLYRCDCSAKETECVISEKKFKKAVQDLDLNLGNVKYIDLEEIYLNQGRLYFDIDTEWTKKSGSGKEVVYNKEEMFSVSLDDFEKLQYEDKLMEYLDKKGEFRKDSYTSSGYRYHTSHIEGIVDGKIIATYYKDKGEDYDNVKSRYVIYDLRTGQIEDMAEKEYEDYVD